jgi:hypothetical protein
LGRISSNPLKLPGPEVGHAIADLIQRHVLALDIAAATLTDDMLRIDDDLVKFP